MAAGIPIPRVMITAESIERGKPDPDCYLRGAEALGADPRDCIVVEDAPIGATWASRRACGSSPSPPPHRMDQLEPADLIVPDLTHIVVRVTERTNGA